MLSKEDESYLAGISGNSERPKARKALLDFKNWLLSEHGREGINPTLADIAQYEEYLKGKGYKDSTIGYTMSRICRRYNLERKKKGEQVMIDESTVVDDGVTIGENEQVKSHGGRKTLDKNGEKRSEKFMLYLTPSLIADIRDWCSLKRVSCVEYITGLISADLESKRDKLNTYRELSESA